MKVHNYDIIEFFIVDLQYRDIDRVTLYNIFSGVCCKNNIVFARYLINNFSEMKKNMTDVFLYACLHDYFDLALMLKFYYPETDHEMVYNLIQEDNPDDTKIIEWLKADCPMPSSTKSARKKID